MINGGPRAVFWGLLVTLPGAACQAASLAEMASILLVPETQYHWIWLLGPLKHKRFITWIQCWITWFGWIAILAAAVNLLANFTTTLALAAHSDYSAQRPQTTPVSPLEEPKREYLDVCIRGIRTKLTSDGRSRPTPN